MLYHTYALSTRLFRRIFISTSDWQIELLSGWLNDWTAEQQSVTTLPIWTLPQGILYNALLRIRPVTVSACLDLSVAYLSIFGAGLTVIQSTAVQMHYVIDVLHLSSKHRARTLAQLSVFVYCFPFFLVVLFLGSYNFYYLICQCKDRDRKRDGATEKDFQICMWLFYVVVRSSASHELGQ